MSKTGPHILPITTSAFVVAIPVASTATVYTISFSMFLMENFSLHLIGTTGTTIEIAVWLEEGSVRPTTEGSADTTNMAVPEGAPAIITITDEVLHVEKFSPVVGKIGRLKFIGGSTNAADATLTAKLSFMEN